MYKYIPVVCTSIYVWVRFNVLRMEQWTGLANFGVLFSLGVHVYLKRERLRVSSLAILLRIHASAPGVATERGHTYHDHRWPCGIAHLLRQSYIVRRCQKAMLQKGITPALKVGGAVVHLHGTGCTDRREHTGASARPLWAITSR
jgi:hypothetical protein